MMFVRDKFNRKNGYLQADIDTMINNNCKRNNSFIQLTQCINATLTTMESMEDK